MTILTMEAHSWKISIWPVMKNGNYLLYVYFMNIFLVNCTYFFYLILVSYCSNHNFFLIFQVQSSTFVGIMIAAMGTGILADKYGRKHVVMSCLAVTIVSAIFQTFSNSFWMYLFFQMLTSLGQAGFFQTGFILGMNEYHKIIILQIPKQ